MAWNPDDDPPPFDELLRHIERMMDEMDGAAWGGGFDASGGSPAGQRRPGRDVHVDFHEEDDELRVVADLPGVTEDAIEVKSNGEVLEIRASTDARDYRERIDLPVAVDEETATATYNNGVLEVTFETDADDDTVIEVE